MNNIIDRINIALDRLDAPPLHKGRHNFLAQLTGCTDRTVRNWFSTGIIPDSKRLALAKALKVNCKWLESGIGILQELPSTINLGREEIVIPLLSMEDINSWLSGSYVIKFNDNCFEIASNKNMSDKSFIISIVDDQNDPPFQKGTLLFIDPQKQSRHKNYVLVEKYDSSTHLIRQRIDTESYVLLESMAKGVATTRLAEKDKILGVVVQQRLP